MHVPTHSLAKLRPRWLSSPRSGLRLLLLVAVVAVLFLTLPANAHDLSADTEAAAEIVCREGVSPESGECYVDDTRILSGPLRDRQGAEPVGELGTLNMFREKVVCFGDGNDAHRVQVVYLRQDTSTTPTPTARLQRIAGRVASTFEESARAHGGAVKSPRFVHDKNCRAVVMTVTASKAELDGGYYSIVERLDELGLDRPDRKYLVFIETNPFCGLSSHNPDERANPATNRSENRPGYSLTGSGCWEYAAAHELIHAMGAVNRGAPNTSGASHCLDDHDIMCYKDKSGKSTYIRCADLKWEDLLDCGGDDYFNPNPAPGTYLARHWNIYNSRFLDLVPAGTWAPQKGDSIGLYDSEGRVRLVTPTTRGLEVTSQFYYGNPGDYLFSGDWNCDGVATPGLYRQSDGYVYLRNSNTQGVADISFYFGNPGDIPIAGDFDGDGCDTVSVYRPSNATFYIINKLGSSDKGLGWAEYSFVFGHPRDVPFVGDFDGDGVDTVGLHRPSTGEVFLKNKLAAGWADLSFYYGRPGDMLTAGDWDGDGTDTVAVYRPGTAMLYLKNTNSPGFAAAELHIGPAVGIAGFR